jgi:hypothetical protein
VGNATRDPRGWSLSIAWRPVDEATSLPLAFDHVETLKGSFTLSELQSVYERILGRPLDKSAFRKRMAKAEFVEALPRDASAEQPTGADLPDEEGYETVFFDRII